MIDCESAVHGPEVASADGLATVVQLGRADDLQDRADVAKLFSLVAQDDVAALRDQALTILGGRSSDASLAVALQSLAYAAWNQGHVSDALDLIGAAVSRSDRMSCLSHQPRLFWASMLTSLGNFEHAEQVIGDCRVQIERAGGTTWATAPPPRSPAPAR